MLPFAPMPSNIWYPKNMQFKCHRDTIIGLQSSNDSEKKIKNKKKRDINTHDGVFMAAELPSNAKEYPGKSTNGSAIKQQQLYRAFFRKNRKEIMSLNKVLSVQVFRNIQFMNCLRLNMIQKVSLNKVSSFLFSVVYKCFEIYNLWAAWGWTWSNSNLVLVWKY